MFSLFSSNNEEEKSLLSDPSSSSYSSNASAPIPTELWPQPTEDDPLVNQVTCLLNLKKVDCAYKVVKTAIEEESKRREITPDTFHVGMTMEELKKNAHETPYQMLEQKILSFKEVKKLIAAEHVWFGLALFRQPQVLTNIDDIIYRLRYESAILRAMEPIIKELETTIPASTLKRN